MSGWAIFWSIFSLLAAFGIGFWVGFHVCMWLTMHYLRDTIQKKGYFEMKGIRFIPFDMKSPKSEDHIQ